MTPQESDAAARAARLGRPKWRARLLGALAGLALAAAGYGASVAIHKAFAGPTRYNDAYQAYTNARAAIDAGQCPILLRDHGTQYTSPCFPDWWYTAGGEVPNSAKW